MMKARQFIPDEDEALLVAWHKGDQSAFETLVWKYQKRIYNIALLLTGVEGAAAEAAENSFLSAYRGIRSLKAGIRFSAWLILLVIQECRTINEYLVEKADETYTALKAKGDLQDRLEHFLLALPIEQSELLILRYVRSYPLPRLVEIYQLREEVIESRLFRAQEELVSALRQAAGQTPAKTTHPEVRCKFAAYLDNSIEEKEKESVKTHLKNCGSCREGLVELEWLAESLRAIPDMEPPHWLASAIMKRIRAVPLEQPKKPPESPYRLQIFALLALLTVVAVVPFILPKGNRTASLQQESPSEPARETAAKKDTSALNSVTNLIKGAFRPGSLKTPPAEPNPSQPLPVPLPTNQPRQEAPTVTQQLLQKQPAAAEEKPQQATKGKLNTTLPSPLEWGDAPPKIQPRQTPAATSQQQSSEMTVSLQVTDMSSASEEIEAAVSASGGRITGRGHSSGSDIIYTRVDADRYLSLVGRLSRAGRILEMPAPPDGSAGAVDLVIKWR